MRDKFFEIILAIEKEANFSILLEKIPLFYSEPLGFSLILDKLKSRTRLLIYLSVNKWSSDEKQLASDFGSKSTLSPTCCPRFSSESELSLLNVGGFGTGNSSLCGTGLIVDGKAG